MNIYVLFTQIYVLYFRCVHHLVLFFIAFSSPTFIIYLSLYLTLWLSLLRISLPLSLSSATFTVTLQTCKPSSSPYLAHSLAFISHPHPLYSLLFRMLSLSLSLSFFTHINSHFSNMYTIPPLSLSLSHVLAFLSLQPCSPPLFPLSLSFFLYLSPTISLSLSVSLSLSSAMLTHFTIFCCGRHLPPFLPLPFLSLPLSLFSHTHTLYSLLLRIRPLSLSIFRHVHYPHIYIPPSHYISLSLFSPSHCFALSSAMLIQFTRFCCGHHLSLSLSLSPSLFYVHPTNRDKMDNSLYFSSLQHMLC